MNSRDPNRPADKIVFWTCVAGSLILYTLTVWDDGYAAGKNAPKVCASVPGQQVVSTTADTCTYANSYGRSTTKRRAG